jgi:hypothetical protein
MNLDEDNLNENSLRNYERMNYYPNRSVYIPTGNMASISNFSGTF